MIDFDSWKMEFEALLRNIELIKLQNVFQYQYHRALNTNIKNGYFYALVFYKL